MELTEGREAATGGGEERREAAASYTIPQAAAALSVPVRTLRDWIRSGAVSTFEPLPPARGARISGEALSVLRQAAAARGGEERRGAGDGGGEGRRAAAELESSVLNPPRHEAAPLACECCKVREEHAATLTAMIEARTVELRRRDQAEGELRRVLALLEQTNRELSAALVQKALPLAPVEAPARVRWWWPWRR